MLKPIESPPPSLAPRFAASITPGPPPVTTANPAAENRRPVDPVDRLEAGLEFGGDPLDVALEVLVLAPLVEDTSVFQGLDAALDVRRAHRDPERGCQPEVGDGDGDPLPGRDRVVRACLRGVAGAPAVPELHRADDE